MSKRKGDWMHTYTGRKFYPLDPREDEINIIDIAHALSMNCRYNGHTKKFYSVAEHCVLMTDYLPQELKLAGLLHDSAEAYMSDLIHPIKKNMPKFYEIENRLLNRIYQRYNIEIIEDEWDFVKQIDFDIAGDEKEQAMNNPNNIEWEIIGVGLGAKLKFWSPELAKVHFLLKFVELFYNKK